MRHAASETWRRRRQSRPRYYIPTDSASSQVRWPIVALSNITFIQKAPKKADGENKRGQSASGSYGPTVHNSGQTSRFVLHYVFV